MDMNQLLHAHQIALIGKARTTLKAPCAAYGDTIALLAGRIQALREDGGADVGAGRFVTGEPVAEYLAR
jgi:hypothetical protein